MQLLTHEQCSLPAAWGRWVTNDTHLCAGYTSGFITTCNVSRRLVTVATEHIYCVYLQAPM